MTALTDPPAPPGRLRTAWRAAHAPADGVPRWARTAALAVPLVVLPSGIWRLPIAFGHEHGMGEIGGGERVYVVFLSIFSELLAFTAVGLVATWGERFPRWFPLVGGRNVPPMAAVVPGALGAIVLTVLWTHAVVGQFMGITLQGEPLPDNFPSKQGGWEAAFFYLCYAPLVLWGPLLGAVTYAYHRRRRAGRPRGR
ncbi:hypothetical protein [Actinomadura sediminis]|uniref:DUF3995 domain-containing protein n=1 Tax=Actinomadura sediminis TaxID=1038904 RepID=A0ABW3F544_9ACTN